jgi:hypothetical protein
MLWGLIQDEKHKPSFKKLIHEKQRLKIWSISINFRMEHSTYVGPKFCLIHYLFINIGVPSAVTLDTIVVTGESVLGALNVTGDTELGDLDVTGDIMQAGDSGDAFLIQTPDTGLSVGLRTVDIGTNDTSYSVESKENGAGYLTIRGFDGADEYTDMVRYESEKTAGTAIMINNCESWYNEPVTFDNTVLFREPVIVDADIRHQGDIVMAGNMDVIYDLNFKPQSGGSQVTHDVSVYTATINYDDVGDSDSKFKIVLPAAGADTYTLFCTGSSAEDTVYTIESGNSTGDWTTFVFDAATRLTLPAFTTVLTGSSLIIDSGGALQLDTSDIFIPNLSMVGGSTMIAVDSADNYRLVTVTSSKRYKKKIRNMYMDSRGILDIQLREYQRIGQDDKWEVGYIAEEGNHVPGLVNVDMLGRPESYNFPSMAIHHNELLSSLYDYCESMSKLVPGGEALWKNAWRDMEFPRVRKPDMVPRMRF